MVISTKRLSTGLYWLAIVLIVLLGIWLRLVATMRLPLFVDEAIHILRAHRVVEGQIFFSDNIRGIRKWLYPNMLALFRPMGPEGPWLARALSALAGAVAISACVALGNMVGDRRAGLLAGLLYAVLPLAVFHERQALADPVMAALTAVCLVLMVRLARRPRWWVALALGVLLAAACLTKLSALPFLVLPLVAVVVLAEGWEGRWRGLAFSGGALGVAVGLGWFVYQQFVRQREMGGAVRRVVRDNLRLLIGSGEAGDYANRLVVSLPDYVETFVRYVGWVPLALAGLAVVWAIAGKKRREVLFLIVPGLVFSLVPVLAVRPAEALAPRYFLVNAAPLVVMVALAWGLLVEWVRAQGRMAARWVGGVVLVAMLVPAVWFDASLIRDPAGAPLARVDRGQYIEGQPSGYGHADVAAALLEAWHAGGEEELVVLTTGSAVWLQAYLGPRVAVIDSFGPQTGYQEEALPGWLAGGPVYIVEEWRVARLPSSVHGLQLADRGTYMSGGGRLSLFLVSGVEGPFADRVYDSLAPDPAGMGGDYAALAGALAGDVTPRTVLVFPAGHAAALGELSDLDVRPLSPGGWPLERERVDALLDGLELGEGGTPLEVILVDEARTDPERVILLGLQRELYFERQEWFGLVHRLRYVSGPSAPRLPVVGARFEGDIELVEGGILDGEVRAGDVVRVMVVWRAGGTVGDSFNVFVHVIGADGGLKAQYDSVPGGGLLPMTSWLPGQQVGDRMAIRLPGDIEAGSYQVRVGIYHPGSGLRLPVVSGQGAAADYVVLGQISVDGAE